MKSKVIRRSAMIIAAGVCMSLWGPLQPMRVAAAPAASQDNATQLSAPAAAKKKPSRTFTHNAKKKATPAKAAKPTAEKAKDQSEHDSAASDVSKSDGALKTDASVGIAKPSTTLPPSVANANAQFLPVTAAGSAKPGPDIAVPSTPATPDASTDTQLVPPDEVNDLDRAAADTPPPAVMAATSPAPAAATANSDPDTLGAAQVTSATSDAGAWDKASLIGKIFIAAGGLLTLASAARMFMA